MSNLSGNISGKQTLSGDLKIQVAPTPEITVGTTTTLSPGSNATVELDAASTGLKPIFNFGIPEGKTYVMTEDDFNGIETNIKSDIQPIIENIESVAYQAEVIAKGRATGYVFDTLQDLDNWLSVSDNVAKLVLGDNLYIRAIGVPDYWWDGTSKQILETEKPDLTEYAKKEQFVTLTQEQYDALTEKGANTYYFIPEEE